MKTLRGLFALICCTLIVYACGTDAGASDDGAAVTVQPPVVTIHARDYQFVDAPDTVVAGLTTLRLINEGPEFHHVQLVRFDDGHTLQDFFDAMRAGGPPPAWFVEVGGPNTPGMPGDSTMATVDLVPGNYALLCFIPSPDGTPHIMKGMARPLTVVANTATAPSLPAADVVMTLNDYSFETSAPITAGARTIRVENAAAQAHEVLIVKLEEGRSAPDFVKFVTKPEGTPPGRVIGGTTGIASGTMNQITLTFEPGRYALLCFLPDAKDGKEHIAHGMVKEITVQ
jgi:uncharacterized cupredoxin-like copper-binding protein